MRILLASLVLVALGIAPAKAGLIPDWGQAYGDEGTTDRQYQAMLAADTDDAGNLYVAGQFQGQINLGGSTLFATAPGSPDFFVAKLSSSGQHIWSLSGGGSGADIVNDIVVSPSGGVAVVGQTTSPTFTVAGVTDTTNGGADAFVMLFGSNGTHTFTQVYGGPLTDTAQSVVWDTSALSLIVSGTFWSTVDFGVGPPRTSSGMGDFYLAEIKVWGAMAAVGTNGGTGNETWAALCLDDNGDLGFAGTFANTINFGNGPMTSVGTSSVVLAKIPSVGTAATWSESFSTVSSGDACLAASITTNGSDFYVTGNYTGSASFGVGTHTSAGESDVWLGAYKSGGVPVWTRAGGSTELDFASHIDYHDGKIVISGAIEGPATFDSRQIPHSNRFDALLLVYDAFGTIEEGVHGGGTWDDFGYQAAINDNGIYFVGSFRELGAFSGLTLNALDNEPDGFIVNYVENALVGVSDSEAAAAATLVLGPPTPNPARAGTVINYGVGARGRGIESAAVYDAEGRMVRAIRTEPSARSGRLQWDGRNEAGARVGPGVYFFRASDGATTTHRRVTVIR